MAGIAAVQATGAFVGLDWWNSGRNGVTIHFFRQTSQKRPWGLVSGLQGLQKSTTKTIPNMFWSWQLGQQCFQWPHHL